MKLNSAPAQTELNDGDSLEIERIYIPAPFQGKGRGRQLLDFAVGHAQRQNETLRRQKSECLCFLVKKLSKKSFDFYRALFSICHSGRAHAGHF